ncbi:MAG: hypothetical protein V4805_06400 [Pseudomonadota bacterium]
MTLIRLAFLYIHLLACCVAIGMTIVNDIMLIRRILTGDVSDRRRADLDNLQSTIMIALILLWTTGISVTAFDVFADGLHVFENPKLQAKILVCLALTINGIVLHHQVFPVLQKAGSILKLEHFRLKLALITGTISGISWLYVAFLGIARPLAWKYSLFEMLIAYPLLIMMAYMSFRWTLDWSRKRTENLISQFAKE